MLSRVLYLEDETKHLPMFIRRTIKNNPQPEDICVKETFGRINDFLPEKKN